MPGDLNPRRHLEACAPRTTPLSPRLCGEILMVATLLRRVLRVFAARFFGCGYAAVRGDRYPRGCDW